MRRGEIWWAALDPPAGRRPVLLLSRNQAYRVRESVTVAPLTTRIRRIAAEVTVGPVDGVPTDSVVNLDNMQTIVKRKLQSRIVELSDGKMLAVAAAIRWALALD